MISYDIPITVALIVSAFLSIHLDENIHAVASFGAMMVLLSGLYFALGALFAAVFQLAIGVGTIAVFFLAGEMLSSKKRSKQSVKNKISGVIIATVLSIPSIILTVTPPIQTAPSSISFSEALWRLRGLDLTAQAFVILVISLGVSIILKRRRS